MNKKANRLKNVLGYIINFVLNIGAIHYVYPENWLRVSTNYRKELTTWLFVVGSFLQLKICWRRGVSEVKQLETGYKG